MLVARFGPLPERRGAPLMMSACPCMIVLPVGGIVGISAIETYGWPAAAAVLLIGLHAVVDLAAWMLSAARTRASARAAQADEPRG